MPRAAACVLLFTCLAVPVCLPGERPAPPAVDHFGDPLPPGAVARLGTVRLRHASGIEALAFSPDGKLLASGSHDETLRLWDARSGREVRRLKEIQGQVYTLAFSPDGKLLAASGGHNTIHLWDPTTGREVRRLSGHKNGVRSLAFSADGKTLASTAGDRTTRLWDLRTGKEVRHIIETRDRGFWVALLPDGKTVASAGEDETVRFWAGEGVPPAELKIPGLRSAALAPDGKALLSVEEGGLVHLWDVATGKQLGTFKGTMAAFAPDGKSVAALADSGDVRLWDAATGKELRRFGVRHGSACAIAFAPDGRTLALSGSAIRLWDVQTGKQILPLGDGAGEFAAVAFTPDGKSIAASGQGQLWLLDPATGKPRRRFASDATAASPLAVSPDGRTAALLAGPNRIRLVDLNTGQLVRDLRRRQEQITGIAFAPDSRTLASVGNREIALWDVATGKDVGQLAERFAASPIAFAPDGKGVFAAAGYGTVGLWDVDTGKKVRGFREPHLGEFRPSIVSVAVSPDGKLLAVTWTGHFEPFAVELWEVATGQSVAVFGGHENIVWSVAFSPDSRSLVSGSADRTVRVWDVFTAAERRRFTGHRGRVYEVAYAPDGRTVVSRGADGTAIVWDVASLPAVKPVARPALEECWKDLAGADAARAFRAQGAMVAGPGPAVAFLKERLRPVAGVAPNRIAELIADLDDPRFAVRLKATAELEKLSDLAEPALREVLHGKASLEKRQRVEQLLHRAAEMSPEAVRAWRALAVLEHVGSAEARSVLEALARGEAEARLTREARTALGRLARRTAP